MLFLLIIISSNNYVNKQILFFLYGQSVISYRLYLISKAIIHLYFFFITGKQSNALELRPLEAPLPTRGGGGGGTRDAIEDDEDSQDSNVFEERETWFTNTRPPPPLATAPLRPVALRTNKDEQETVFNGEGEQLVSATTNTRVKYSQEEMRWIEEEVSEEDEEEEVDLQPVAGGGSMPTDSSRGVRFNQDVEVLGQVNSLTVFITHCIIFLCGQ